jgi:O-antigen ligase
VIAILLFGYLASDAFIERMNTLTEPVEAQAEADMSVATRLELLQVQWRMAMEHPLGVGNSGTAALSYTYMESKYWSSQGGRSSHNSIMSALVEQGFPGAFVWILIMVLLALKLRANRRWCVAGRDTEAGWLNAGLAGMFAVVVVAGLFSPQERTEVYVWILAMTCAFAHIRNAAIDRDVDLEPEISVGKLVADERIR